MRNNINTNKIIKIIILYLIVLATLALSWSLSSQNGNQSSLYTKKLAEKLAQILYRYGEIDITSVIGWNGWIYALNEIIRKFIHFFEYGFIGMILCVTLNMTLKKEWLAAFLSLLICTTWGFLDEYHQLFVAGRCFRWFDLGVDFTGALLAIILTACFLYCFRRIKSLKKWIAELDKQKIE